jgi:hypothetical protein
MTMTIRKQLSVAAWGASAMFCLLLFVSALAAVAHSHGHTDMPTMTTHP